MPKSNPDSSRPIDPTEIALRAEVTQLRRDLDTLRASLAEEVRTRRLVVEESDGFERLTAGAEGDGGSLVLHVRPLPVDDDRSIEPTSVRLYADEETYSAGVLLLGPADEGERGAGGGQWDVSRGAYPADHARTSFFGDQGSDLKARVAQLEADNAQLRRFFVVFGETLRSADEGKMAAAS